MLRIVMVLFFLHGVGVVILLRSHDARFDAQQNQIAVLNETVAGMKHRLSNVITQTLKPGTLTPEGIKFAGAAKLLGWKTVEQPCVQYYGVPVRYTEYDEDQTCITDFVGASTINETSGKLLIRVWLYDVRGARSLQDLVRIDAGAQWGDKFAQSDKFARQNLLNSLKGFGATTIQPIQYWGISDEQWKALDKLPGLGWPEVKEMK
jgi:hypothetical protein